MPSDEAARRQDDAARRRARQRSSYPALVLWATVTLGCSAKHLPAELPATVDGASGEQLFGHVFTPEQALGPLYNAQSCAKCHEVPSMGGSGLTDKDIVYRVAFIDDNGHMDDLNGRGGPIARNHSVAELGYACPLRPGVPASSNAVSTRDTPPLFGLGLVESIPDDVIVAGVAGRPDGVSGHPNWVEEGGVRRVGRFGWKASTATLQVFVSRALRNELGISTPDFPEDLVSGPDAEACVGFHRGPEIDAPSVARLRDYVASLPPFTPASDLAASHGRAVFERVGCSACHAPTLAGSNGPVALYSDLLLHDMGPALRDGFFEGDAKERDWRTTPLWGLRYRKRYLHDARTTTLEDAIRAHGGEAAAAAGRFALLTADDASALLEFLRFL